MSHYVKWLDLSCFLFFFETKVKIGYDGTGEMNNLTDNSLMRCKLSVKAIFA